MGHIKHVVLLWCGNSPVGRSVNKIVGAANTELAGVQPPAARLWPPIFEKAEVIES